MEDQDKLINTTPRLCQAFKNGLYEKYRITYDEIKTWEFCGGQKHPRAAEYSNSDFNRYEQYFYKCFPDAKFLDLIDECVCGQTICHNGYIRKDKNATVNEIIIVGSCCIKHFIDTGLKRICESCNKPHKSHYLTEGNSCRSCRLLITKEQNAIIKDQKKYKKKFKSTLDAIISRKNAPPSNIKKEKEEMYLRLKQIKTGIPYKELYEELKREQELAKLNKKQIKEINNANIVYFYFPSGKHGAIFQEIINEMKGYKTIIKNPKTGHTTCYNSFTFDFDIKAWHCKETIEFKDIINKLRKYRISDIDKFKTDRKYYKVKYEQKEIAKECGLYWDNMRKSWYKQNTNYLIN